MGPLLFVLFINDISTFLPSGVSSSIFADDIKLYSTFKCHLDYVALQSALAAIFEWSSNWQLPISASKCSFICLGNKQLLKSQPVPNFEIANVVLPQLESIRDLGVIVDSNLSFAQHIRSLVNNAHFKSNLIFRCFNTRDTRVLVKAYTTYVRPSLEYCSSAWSPVYKGLIRAIESVQRRFTKRLRGMYHLSYPARNKALGLQSLELRRLSSDLTTCYKLLHGICDADFGRYFTLLPSTTRGHRYKILMPHVRTNTRKHYFSARIVPPWNFLPASVAEAPSLNSFKLRLKQVDLNDFLICI